MKNILLCVYFKVFFTHIRKGNAIKYQSKFINKKKYRKQQQEIMRTKVIDDRYTCVYVYIYI